MRQYGQESYKTAPHYRIVIPSLAWIIVVKQGFLSLVSYRSFHRQIRRDEVRRSEAGMPKAHAKDARRFSYWGCDAVG